MSLSDALGIGRGEKVCVIGCGGKTALIAGLARECAGEGVLIAPTTRIARRQMLHGPGIAYLGREMDDKLCAAPLEQIEAASRDWALTLMEADGSRMLPLKGWAEGEPVIPAFATMVVGVFSVAALGLRATTAHVHRLPLFLEITGLREGDTVDAAALARMILAGMERCPGPRRAVLLNQAEDEWGMRAAQEIAARLGGFEGAMLLGSAQRGEARRV